MLNPVTCSVECCVSKVEFVRFLWSLNNIRFLEDTVLIIMS